MNTSPAPGDRRKLTRLWCPPVAGRLRQCWTSRSGSMSTTHVAEPVTDAQLDQLCINTIRTLSIAAVQQAKSGRPGTPMALAPLAYTLCKRGIGFNPQEATCAT